MKYIALLAGVLLICSGGASAQKETEAESMKVEIVNSQGETIGHATLALASQGVKVAVQVSKLPLGPHGFHIHAVGACDPPAFTTAGGHFNPMNKQHGLQNPAGPHAGDLPDLVVGPDGTAETEILAPGLRFADSPESIFPPGGTALVIHARADDGRTDPDGNAGERIACGIIRDPKRKSTAN
jgi:Cu-Zn family superoxide dismutase